MRSFVFAYWIFVFFHNHLRAQQLPGDSLFSNIGLQEICICEDGDSSDSNFNFWQRNKLSTTEDILSRMQGVTLIRRGSYGQEPGLRSYNSGQTNLTIDGMKIYGACTDKMDPASIYVEPTNLKSISISHGANGSSFGSTIGGGINLKFQEPEYACHQAISGQLAQSYSSVNNAWNSSIWIQQNINKFAYRISAVHRKASDYLAGDGKRIAYSGFQKGNISIVLQYKPDSNQTIQFTGLADQGIKIGYPALPMDLGRAMAQIYSLSHATQSSKGIIRKNELKVYYNRIVHQMDDSHRDKVVMRMDMPGYSTTTGFYNEISLAGSMNLRLDAHRVTTLSEMTMFPANEPLMYFQSLPENSLCDIGISVNKEFSIRTDHTLQINGRIDQYYQQAIEGTGSRQWEIFGKEIRKTKNDFIWNAGLNYGIKFNHGFQTGITLAQGQRIATGNERYGYYLFNPQDQCDYLGNIDLIPERSFQSELLVKKAWKNGHISLNGFYHHTNDYIYAVRLSDLDPVTINALGLKTYQNISFAILKGFEFSTESTFLENVHYIASLSYTHGKTFDGKPLPLVPPLKLQHALKYTFQKFNLSLEHDYALRQDRINPDYQDRKTAAFHLIHIRFSKNIPIQSSILQASIACENILNVRYREHLDIGNILRPGRNLLLNIAYRF